MDGIEVTFLGTGTSHGIPVIGCGCAVCRSEDPRDRRLRAAVHLRHGGYSLCVDTPPDFRQQCLREGIARLDAVVYTHSHSDHVLGFDDLRRFCEIEDKPMPVYGSAATLRDLRRVFQYAFEGPAFRTYVRPLPVEIDGPFDLGGMRVTPCPLRHGRTTTTGLVFERPGGGKFAYMTDCQEVTDEAVEAARGARVLVVDALRHAAHSTHMTIEQALAAAERIGAERTFFTHMCHEVGHAETGARLPDGVGLAYDGLKLVV